LFRGSKIYNNSITETSSNMETAEGKGQEAHMPDSAHAEGQADIGQREGHIAHGHHRHHRHSKKSAPWSLFGLSHRSKQRDLMTLITENLLVIIAALFFAGGMLWLMYKRSAFGHLATFFKGMLQQGGDVPALKTQGEPLALILTLLPGLLILLFSFVLPQQLKTKKGLSRNLYYVGYAVLFAGYFGRMLYALLLQNSLLFVAVGLEYLVIMLVSALALYITYSMHHPRMHFLTILFGYAGCVLIAALYGTNNHALFLSVLVFSLMMVLMTGTTYANPLNTTNAYAATGVFGLYFVRYIYLGQSATINWYFVTYLSVLYIFLMLISVVRPYKGEDPLKRLYANTLPYTITASGFILIWYLFRRYHMDNLHWILASILGLLCYGFIRISQRISPDQNRKHFYYLLILLIASILPLMLEMGTLVHFGAIAALLFMGYAQYRHKQFAALLAVGSLSFASTMLLFSTVTRDYPAVFLSTDSLPFTPFITCLVSGVFLMLATYLIRQKFRKYSFSYGKWFSRSSTSNYITVLLYGLLYLNAFWLYSYVFMIFFKLPQAQLISWYVFHTGFLLVLFVAVLRQRMWVLQPFLWISLASLLLYPVFVNKSVILLRQLAIEAGGAALSGFYFHFLVIPILVALGLLTGSLFRQQYLRHKGRLVFVLLIQLIFFTYLLMAEYDHIAVFSSTAEFFKSGVIAHNRLLPLSLVLFIESVLLLWLSFHQKEAALRIISLVLVLVTTLKVFLFDFTALHTTQQTMAFWIIGGYFIVYSFLFQRYHKKQKEAASKRHKLKHRHRSE